MSLITEALKKAGRDAERAGPRAALAPSPSQVPSRRLSPRVAVLALLAIGGGALVVLVRGALQGEAQAVAEPVHTAAASTSSAPDPSPADAVVGEPEGEVSEPAVEEVTASTPIAPAGPAAEPPPTESSPRTRRVHRPRPPAAPKTTVVQDVSSPLDGASFLKKVVLPGGGSLALAGIAWSETQPVAVISGSIVSPGERVKGFKVLRINPDSVDLEGENENFTIRLK